MANPTGWKPSMEKDASPGAGALDTGLMGATRGLLVEEALVFEQGSPGRVGVSLPPVPAGSDPAAEIPAALLRGEPGREDIEIGLVVGMEETRVEVRRADRHPRVVHDQPLAVVHGGLVLVEARAGLEQLAPPGPRGGLNRRAIHVLAGPTAPPCTAPV